MSTLRWEPDEDEDVADGINWKLSATGHILNSATRVKVCYIPCGEVSLSFWFFSPLEFWHILFKQNLHKNVNMCAEYELLLSLLGKL